MAGKAPTATGYTHIARSPRFLGGEARIAGHRIRVRDIVAARDVGGLSPEEIAANVYPGLSLAEVYAALAYYEDHREEIDLARKNERRRANEFLCAHPELARDVRPRTR